MISWFEKNLIVSWLIVILLAIFIFFISSQSFYGGLPGPEWKSYVYHFGIFFLFAFFLMISLFNSGKKRSLIIWAIFFALFYAATDEYHQIFVPNRDASIIDVLTDSFGILLSGFFYLVYRKFKTKK